MNHQPQSGCYADAAHPACNDTSIRNTKVVVTVGMRQRVFTKRTVTGQVTSNLVHHKHEREPQRQRQADEEARRGSGRCRGVPAGVQTRWRNGRGGRGCRETMRGAETRLIRHTQNTSEDWWHTSWLLSCTARKIKAFHSQLFLSTLSSLKLRLTV